MVVGMKIQTQPMSPDIPALWPRFVPRIAEIQNLSEPRVSYGVMWQAEGSMSILNYMAAVAVAAQQRIAQGMVCLAIPAGTFASFRYPLAGLAKGFGEIFNRWLPSSDYDPSPGIYFERYDEAFDPGDPNSLVEICIRVQRRKAVVNS
jgi:AraC family transcriptional regulator